MMCVNLGVLLRVLFRYLRYALLIFLMPCAGGGSHVPEVSMQACGQGVCLKLISKVSMKPKQLILQHPDRWVLDVPHAHIQQLSRWTSICKMRASLCHKIRVGRHGRWMRIVVQTHRPVKAVLQVLHPQLHRWIYHWRIMPQPVLKSIHVMNARRAILKKPVRQHSLSARAIKVLIDPGHGGKDPGAIGRGYVREKTVVLAISKQLSKRLNQNKLFKAMLTRSDDRYLTLRERLQAARRHRVDCFIAIHADAFWNRQAHGVSVYALSERGASSEAARWLAHQENTSELMGGVRLDQESSLLKKVLMSLQQNATVSSSFELGQVVLSNLGRVAPLHHRRVEQAAFVVLKSPDILSLLIETGFVSNAREAKQLKRPAYQYQLAGAIYHGLIKYFRRFPPSGTRVALEQQGRWIKVHKGDTLYKIAQRHHISLAQLRLANPDLSVQLKIGQRLLIVDQYI